MHSLYSTTYICLAFVSYLKYHTEYINQITGNILKVGKRCYYRKITHNIVFTTFTKFANKTTET